MNSIDEELIASKRFTQLMLHHKTIGISLISHLSENVCFFTPPSEGGTQPRVPNLSAHSTADADWLFKDESWDPLSPGV